MASIGAAVRARDVDKGGFLGAFSLLPGTKEFALYASAVDAATKAMSETPSIANHSIVSAVEGDFGDVHRTRRTRGSRLWINPLMAMYCTFELEALASHVQYLSRLAPQPDDVRSRGRDRGAPTRVRRAASVGGDSGRTVRLHEPEKWSSEGYWRRCLASAASRRRRYSSAGAGFWSAFRRRSAYLLASSNLYCAIRRFMRSRRAQP